VASDDRKRDKLADARALLHAARLALGAKTFTDEQTVGMIERLRSESPEPPEQVDGEQLRRTNEALAALDSVPVEPYVSLPTTEPEGPKESQPDVIEWMGATGIAKIGEP